jgi:hypothetical protein
MLMCAGIVRVKARVALLTVVSVLRAGAHVCLCLANRRRTPRQVEAMLAERHGDRSKALQREP